VAMTTEVIYKKRRFCRGSFSFTLLSPLAIVDHLIFLSNAYT